MTILRAPQMAGTEPQQDSRPVAALSAARAAQARTKPAQRAAAGVLDWDFAAASLRSRMLRMDHRGREAGQFGGGLDPRLDWVGPRAVPWSPASVPVLERAADWSFPCELLPKAPRAQRGPAALPQDVPEAAKTAASTARDAKPADPAGWRRDLHPRPWDRNRRE